MLKNNLKKKSIIAVFIVIIILLIPISSATGSNTHITNDTNSNKQVEIATIEQNTVNFENKANYNNYIMIRILINFIKIRFNDFPEIVSLCEKSYSIILKLPDGICEMLFFFVFYPLYSSLYELWYNHPNYFIRHYAYFMMNFVELSYIAICDWYPYPYYSWNLKSSITKITLSNMISPSIINHCHCLQK